ncbi:MAG TPA: hypothetical protein VEQ42_00180, partial [Pyrinomonadaceae bacterium]|nr:hypothetical protein [Pyrinomonadaceae bacterium]
PTVPAPDPKGSKEPTGDAVAEYVVYFYGSRAGMAQVQKSGVERGRTTRAADEGRSEEITYERHFMRGETSAKDKIRLNQKLPSVEYSIVYNDGRLFGLINGTSFTPRQEALAPFLADRHHGLGTLLRYKEDGATVAYVGKEKQKNIDMHVIDLTDKEKRRTRYYVSAQRFRVLWLEYEETPPGASQPVKYKRTFHDYRYAQGQLVPFRSVLFADGRQAEESSITNVSFGVKLDEAIFKEAQAATAEP